MARVVLTRAMTYVHASKDVPGKIYNFRRGEPVEVGEQDYIYLMGRGFNDADLSYTLLKLDRVRHLPPGAAVGVVRLGGLGDVLMSMIAVRELVGMRPDLKIVFLTQECYIPLLRDMDFCKYRGAMHRLSIQVFDEGWRKSLPNNQLLLANLQGTSETRESSGSPRVDLYCESLTGRKPSSYEFPFYPRQEEAERGAELVMATGAPILGITLHANVRERTWPMRYQVRLAEMAVEAGWQPVFLSAKKVANTPEMDDLGIVNLTGQLKLDDLICVIQACDVLVGPDTGTIHMAEALGVRAVTYYTTVEPDARLRHYNWVRALWSGLPCSPCYHQPCQPAYMQEGAACALSIMPEHVWQEVEFVAANDPPWPLEAAFTPAMIAWPDRKPEKPREKVLRHLQIVPVESVTDRG